MARKKVFGDGGGGAWESDGGGLSSQEVTFALNAEKEGSLGELVGERGARRSAFSPEPGFYAGAMRSNQEGLY